MTFKTEKESIEFFIGWLEDKGFTDINPTQAEDKFCYYDVEAVFNHPKYGATRFRFELKRRRFRSDKYGDCIIEKRKYDKFIEGLKNKEFEQGRVVTFFEDCMVIDNVINVSGTDFKLAGATTEFNNRGLVEKYFVYYRNGKKF